MKAITCWIDESEIINGRERIWIIGQLITTSDAAQYDLLKDLCEAHKTAKTWDALHATEFTQSDNRKWHLLEEWIRIFKSHSQTYFHAFVFNESSWRSCFATPHHYWAHQILFGLGNKMKESGVKIQTMFSNASTVTAIMDRRATVTGHIFRLENGDTSVERVSKLESIYEERMMEALLHQSKRQSDTLSLRFSFVNSRCFDAMQLCDCLTYMIRQRFLFENDLEGISNEFLTLWNKEFLTTKMLKLDDFGYYEKLNYFRSKNQ